MDLGVVQRCFGCQQPLTRLFAPVTETRKQVLLYKMECYKYDIKLWAGVRATKGMEFCDCLET